jgi:predicted GNAT family N-acyltransferase
MNLQIISFSHSNSALFQQALLIRETVFVMEQGVDKSLEYSGDSDAMHYLVFDNETPVCTARWRKTDKGIKLERFAVLAEYRSKGAGKIVLEKIINDIKPLNQYVYLHAQEGAVSFYLKNGFQIVGEMFLEAGIKHFKMFLK